jgi:hypothetical protein
VLGAPRATWMCMRQKAQIEWLPGISKRNTWYSSFRPIPAKKLLFPDPFRPTTTLCLEENGSICVWSLSVGRQRSAPPKHEQGSHDLKPWIVNVLMYMLDRRAAPMDYESTALMSLKPIAVQLGHCSRRKLRMTRRVVGDSI